MIALIGLFVFTGVLFMGISVPLIRGRVKPNLLYGFRTRKTLSSEAIWYPANAYSGRKFFIVGALTTVAALLFAPIGYMPHVGIGGYVAACTIVTTGSVTWSVVQSFRYLSRL